METVSTLLLALAVAAGFLLICGWYPVRWTNRFLIADAGARAEIEDAYRRTLAQILGGAAIALTFAWTWIKDREAIEITRVQTANQQFGSAATLIASKSVDARAAAIYSMENLVGSRRNYYMPVANTLKSVIKAHAPGSQIEGARPSPISDDVQAAVYVLGRMPLAQKGTLDVQHLNFTKADFRSLKAFKGANFSGAVMYAVNFSGADLSKAIFDGVKMSDWQSFGALEWNDKIAEAWQTTKKGERVSFVALLDWADLTDARFKGMSVSGASFENADLSGTEFIEVDLSRAVFADARNLSKATFTKSCFGINAQPIGLSSEIVQSLQSPCP